jgi:hypothetical protein
MTATTILVIVGAVVLVDAEARARSLDLGHR